MNKLLLMLLLMADPGFTAPRELSDHHWIDVERIVAIGDLHGDFDGYMKTLLAAGLVDKRGHWDAGETHLVQTGDIPDRGADTRRIIEHMMKLARQAHKQGGRVHNLIGNHEAMNVYGDLRYVTDVEYQAFADGRSQRVRDNYYDAVLQNMSAKQPEKYANLPDDHRQQWFDEHPSGWIEHRQAWNPNWSDDGKMYQWVAAARVAVQINDSLFVHGGISGFYCQDSLASMTQRAQAKLQKSDPNDLGILTDAYGPLWYRGLAGKAPEAPSETVDAILQQHQAARIVIGHTPTGGYIWPRYDGRVIQIDTGIGAYYGGHVAYLEITPQALNAGYSNGKLVLPSIAVTDTAKSFREDLISYLQQVSELLPHNEAARIKLAELQAEPQPPVDEPTELAEIIPICGTRQ